MGGGEEERTHFTKELEFKLGFKGSMTGELPVAEFSGTEREQAYTVNKNGNSTSSDDQEERHARTPVGYENPETCIQRLGFMKGEGSERAQWGPAPAPRERQWSLLSDFQVLAVLRTISYSISTASRLQLFYTRRNWKKLNIFCPKSHSSKATTQKPLFWIKADKLTKCQVATWTHHLNAKASLPYL